MIGIVALIDNTILGNKAVVLAGTVFITSVRILHRTLLMAHGWRVETALSVCRHLKVAGSAKFKVM